MTSELKVDIAGLRNIGVTIETPVAGIDETVGRELGRLTVTGAAAGWDVRTELAEAAAAWSAYLNGLDQRVKAFGTDLVTTADQLHAADLARAHQNRVPNAGSRPDPSYQPPEPMPTPSPSPSAAPSPSAGPSPSASPSPSPSASPAPSPSPSASPEFPPNPLVGP